MILANLANGNVRVSLGTLPGPMLPTKTKRNYRLSVPATKAEMATICRLYQRRKVPALVRALLLGNQRPEMAFRSPELKEMALMQARIFSQLQGISRSINQSASLSPVTVVELQAALLAILQEMEHDRGL